MVILATDIDITYLFAEFFEDFDVSRFLTSVFWFFAGKFVMVVSSLNVE